MQTVSPQFAANAAADMRPLNWELRASFNKTYDPTIGFFVLDTSTLDSVAVLAPSDNNIIAEWDKYDYIDLTNRAISMEVTHEQIEPYSVVQSIADVVVNNYDNYFTPGSGSAIDGSILPKRPFRILMGFGRQTVPLFVGLSEKMPVIDKVAGTASFHLIDFLSFIFDKDVTDTDILTNVSTSEVLDYLFQKVGLDPSQYVLDDTSYNRFNYFYVEKGQKLGGIINDLMKAEQGRLYLDELGVIRFLSRHNFNTSPVMTFDKSNTIDYSDSGEDDIINYVKLTCDILREQPSQSLWSLSQAVLVKPGESVDVWANFQDIATSVSSPTYSASQIDASYFTSALDEQGQTPYTGITLSSISSFAKASKMTFHNAGTKNGYISAVNLWGTPVKITDTIFVEDFDQTSIDDFGESIYELETTYIQDEQNALSKAAIMINDYKDYASTVQVEVKGTPALQIGDAVTLDLDGYNGVYVTTKKTDTMANGQYRQILTTKHKSITTFFTLDVSELDGTDPLSP